MAVVFGDISSKGSLTFNFFTIQSDLTDVLAEALEGPEYIRIFPQSSASLITDNLMKLVIYYDEFLVQKSTEQPAYGVSTNTDIVNGGGSNEWEQYIMYTFTLELATLFNHY